MHNPSSPELISHDSAEADSLEGEPLLVLGAGVAGLAAADEATRAGVPPVVVEMESSVGGLLRTDRVEGFCFDRGGHRFLTSVPWVLERVMELMGSRLEVRERNSFVFLDGKRVEYPLRFGNLVRELGWGPNLRALASYVAARFRSSPEENLEQWLRSRFGNYLYRTVFEAYSRKLWGVPPREISAEWAPQRISIPSLGGYLRELCCRSALPPRTYARRYLYPHTGIGEVVEALAARVQGAGGRIWLRSKAVKLRRRASGWDAVIQTPSGPQHLRCRAVVSTIPLGALSGLLGSEIPALPTRGLRFLNLGFDHSLPLDATWLYQPDPDCCFTRVQIPAARSPQMVPAGAGSVQLELPLQGDAADPQALVALAMPRLRSMGFELKNPVLAFVREEANAYPIYRPEHRRRARRLVDELSQQPGLLTVGRQGSFSYVFLDRAFADGVGAVRRLLELEPLEVPEGPTRPLPLEAQSLLEKT